MSKHTPLDLTPLMQPNRDSGAYHIGDDGTKHYGDTPEQRRDAERSHNRLVDAAPAMLEELEMWRELGKSLIKQSHGYREEWRGFWEDIGLRPTFSDQVAALLPRGDEA